VKPDDGGDRPRELVRVLPRHLDRSLGPVRRLAMGRVPHRGRDEHRRGNPRLDPFRRKRRSILHDVVEQRDPAIHGNQEAFAQETKDHAGPGEEHPDRVPIAAENGERLLEATLAVGVPLRYPPSPEEQPWLLGDDGCGDAAQPLLKGPDPALSHQALRVATDQLFERVPVLGVAQQPRRRLDLAGGVEEGRGRPADPGAIRGRVNPTRL